MKKYDKNEISSYLEHCHLNNVYGWTTSQKFLLNNFEWIYDTSKFNEDFIKILMKKVMKDFFTKLMLLFLKNHVTSIIIYHFCQKK